VAGQLRVFGQCVPDAVPPGASKRRPIPFNPTLDPLGAPNAAICPCCFGAVIAVAKRERMGRQAHSCGGYGGGAVSGDILP
jgi:hypothetical protein